VATGGLNITTELFRKKIFNDTILLKNNDKSGDNKAFVATAHVTVERIWLDTTALESTQNKVELNAIFKLPQAFISIPN
jgi:hypothetical protein